MSLLAFDVDGTLITCRERQLEVLKVALKALNIRQEVDLDEHWDYKQNGLSTRKALVAQGFSKLAANEVGELWDRSIEEPSFLTLDRPHPGVLELLSTLKRQGFEMVVISARKNLFLLEQQLSYLGLLEYFSRVLVVRAQSDGSEKGGILQKLCPDLYVGDTEMDAQAAKIANVHFCGVATGQRNASFLKSSMLRLGDFPLITLDFSDLLLYV